LRSAAVQPDFLIWYSKKETQSLFRSKSPRASRQLFSSMGDSGGG
jgi:hypothetical protein